MRFIALSAAMCLGMRLVRGEKVEIPLFGMKLIVVGTPEDIPENFSIALDEATKSHLESSLAGEMKTKVSVELETSFVSTQISEKLTKGVDLSVVNVGYRGEAEIDSAGEDNDLTPFLETAFSENGGFWTFADSLVDDTRLTSIGKLQIGINNTTVGEGSLVASAGEDDGKDEQLKSAEEEGGLSSTGLILILVFGSLVAIGLLCGLYTAWSVYQEQELEKLKEKRRQANKLRRLAQNDGRSTSGTDFHNSEGSGPSPIKKTKKTVKTQMGVRKPSRQAKREKSLIAIAELDEESSCSEVESAQDSFVSCGSSFLSSSSSPVIEIDHLRTPDYVRSPDKKKEVTQKSDRLSIPKTNKSGGTARFAPSKINTGLKSTIPTTSKSPSKVSATLLPLHQEESFNETMLSCQFGESSKGELSQGSKTNALWGDLMGSVTSTSNSIASTSRGVKSESTHLPPKRDSIASIEPWKDLMGSSVSLDFSKASLPAVGVRGNTGNSSSAGMNLSKASLSVSVVARDNAVHDTIQVQNGSHEDMEKSEWGDLMGNATSSSSLRSAAMVILEGTSCGDIELNLNDCSGSSDKFFDEGIRANERMNSNSRNRVQLVSQDEKENSESVYDDAVMNELGMSCSYFDLGEDNIGMKSMRWNTSVDLGNFGDSGNLDIEYGGDQNSGSSMGPGWRLT